MTSCTDVNECLSNNGGCDSNALCTNVPGSRACSCNTGWAGDGGVCTDVNECLTNNGGCDTNASCTNTPGSRSCSCNTGWAGDGGICTDVNECLTSNGGCDPNALCTNTQGSRSCACASGWTGDGGVCTDVNECLSNNGGCDPNALCTNTPGARGCSCNSGWAGDGGVCTDVNECLSNNGGCDSNALCTNVPGSRACSCNTGWAGDGGVCTDVNECLTNNGGCDTNAICTNTPGSRRCACKAGWVGDGGTCSCPSGSHDCSGTCSADSSPQTCGSLCTPCPTGGTGEIATCTAGTCGLTCDLGLKRCGAVCRNLLVDNSNCGTCGNGCALGQVCSSGRCVQPCSTSFSYSCSFNILPANLAPLDLQVADFDQDGYRDFAIALGATSFSVTSELRFFKGSSTGSFNQTTPAGTIAEHVTSFDVGDFDSDGLLDVAAIEPASVPPRLHIYLGTSAWTFSSAATFTISDAAANVRVADLNVDGLPDIVVTYYSQSLKSPVVYLNTGSNFLPTSMGLLARVPRPVVYDYDQDGLPDLLSVMYGGCPMVFHQMPDGGFEGIYGSCSPNRLPGFGFLDADHDGKLDMAAMSSVNQTFGQLALYLGNDNPVQRFSAPLTFTSPAPAGMTAADLNLDGLGDLIGVNGMCLGLGGTSFQCNVGAPGTTSCVSPSNTYTEIVFMNRNGDRFPDWAFGSWGDSTGTQNKVCMCNAVCQ